MSVTILLYIHVKILIQCANHVHWVACILSHIWWLYRSIVQVMAKGRHYLLVFHNQFKVATIAKRIGWNKTRTESREYAFNRKAWKKVSVKVICYIIIVQWNFPFTNHTHEPAVYAWWEEFITHNAECTSHSRSGIVAKEKLHQLQPSGWCASVTHHVWSMLCLYKD